jgi:hypothetical protein
MKIQSAGRLGNILFIWAYAFNLSKISNNGRIEIFADKYHSSIDESLLDTFLKLSSNEVRFVVDNKAGLILKIIDRISTSMPLATKALRDKLKVQNEHQDCLTNNAWIQRGYFQDSVYFRECKNEIQERLGKIISSSNQSSDLKRKFPFLASEYQAIHVRLSDFIDSETGVISLESQISCLGKERKTVICTDGSRDEILSRTTRQDFEIITPKESTAWETLAILSGAKLLVTSNSTLSWWSGFISAGNGNMVCIPKIWNKTSSTSMKLPFENISMYTPKFE